MINFLNHSNWYVNLSFLTVKNFIFSIFLTWIWKTLMYFNSLISLNRKLRKIFIVWCSSFRIMTTKMNVSIMWANNVKLISSINLNKKSLLVDKNEWCIKTIIFVNDEMTIVFRMWTNRWIEIFNDLIFIETITSILIMKVFRLIELMIIFFASITSLSINILILKLSIKCISWRKTNVIDLSFFVFLMWISQITYSKFSCC